MTAADRSLDRGAWVRRDWLILVALFAGTVISRIPFRTTLLYAWDSVLYTRALDTFDVTIHQPQPPGHIFYVGLVWLVNRLLEDPNSAMVWISVFAAAGAVAALFWLGRLMFDRSVGLWAALLLATSLSFWVYSEVAYPYTLLCFLGIVVAGAVYRTWQGSEVWVLPAALALGIAGGFRPDLLFFMTPLFAIGMVGKAWWRILASAAILVATTLAWYVPAALLSGGFGAYREASDIQSQYLFTYFSVFGMHGWGAVATNLNQLWRFLLAGISGATPLVLLVLLALPARALRPVTRDRRFWFLLVWIMPCLLFYIFIHVGEFGYVFTFLPALFLLGVWGLARLLGVDAAPDPEPRPARAFLAILAVMVAANFLGYVVSPLPLSANRLAARDDILRCRLDTIRDHFDPANTYIISVYDFEQGKYYLPQYNIQRVDTAVAPHVTRDLPPGTRQVVIFEEFLKPVDSADLREIDICLDQKLYYLPVSGQRQVTVDWDRRLVSLTGGI
ncbi:MAG: hypothetical protein ACYC6B_00110 [Thermoleophilia bacterium]